MKLRELTVCNFRSIKEPISFKKINDFTILVGPNNAGKSNILKVLQFLNRLSRNDPPGSFLEFLHDRTNSNLVIEVILELSNDERQSIINSMKDIDHIFTNIDLDKHSIFKYITYKIEIDAQDYVSELLSITNNKDEFIQIARGLKQGSYGINQIELKKHIANSNSLNFDMPSFNSFSGAGNPKGILNGVNDETTRLILDILRNFFIKIKFVSTIRNLGGAGPAKEVNEFSFNEINAPQVLNTMLQNDTEEFVKLTNELKNCMPKIEKITSPLSGTNVTIRIKEPNLSSPTSIDDISDGIKQIFGLFLTSKTSNSTSLICLEEPEISLHSHTQKKLFKMMRKNPKSQYIITTHSPIFASIDDDIKTFLVTKPNGVSQIREILDKDELIFIKKELGIKNSDTFGYDAVLFVEGHSEEDAIRILAPVLGYDEIGNNIRLTNREGTGAVTRLKQLLGYLKGSDSEVFIIVDKHKEVVKEIPKLIEQKLLNEQNVIIWDKNFEDTFSSGQIIQAMNNLCNQNQLKFHMTSEFLENERKSREVFPIISNHFFELNEKSIKKPELSKELAYVLILDIKTNPKHSSSKIEESLHKIMKIIKSGIKE